MSDTWYRDPLDLPPYEDGYGQLWTIDGTCLNPQPVEPSWLDEWPEDLQLEALWTAVSMDLVDSYEKALRSAGRQYQAGMRRVAVPNSIKMLRETFCAAQAVIAHMGGSRRDEHIARLQRLVDECDRRRPLGPDGKHGDRHTPTCGCEDTANYAALAASRNQEDEDFDTAMRRRIRDPGGNAP